jgi:signal transduction histidine kinase
MNEVIREVVALTRNEIDRHRISLLINLAPDLPVIQGDKVQLQQVMLNLIMNAIEAMSAGSPRELIISSKKDGPQSICVSVSDTGPGLDPGSAERIFDAFYTTKPGGMGIGLSICRSIMQAHGGHLGAHPNSPQGTAFEFTLPAGICNTQEARLDSAGMESIIQTTP